MLDKINQLLNTGESSNVELAIQLARSQNMGDECYYLLRFGDMLDYLRSFEHIDIRRFNFWAPEPTEIAKIEAEISKPIQAQARRFFEQCGGMELFWMDKRSEVYEDRKNTTWPDYGVDGYIDIKGIYEIYHENSLETFGYGHELMDKELSSEEVEATYHSFDHFSHYNDMQAYTGEGFEDNPLLIMGDDHQACYTDARLMDIPSYLELVFHCCGIVDGRPRFLKKYGGHKLPLLTPDKAFFEQYPLPDFNEYPPKLFYPESSFWS